MVELGRTVEQTFFLLLDYLAEQPIGTANPACRLRLNEIYARMRRSGTDLSTWAADSTDYKALIAAAADANEKLEHAQKLATRRLAAGVMPELNACFAALNLGIVAPTPVRAGQRKAA